MANGEPPGCFLVCMGRLPVNHTPSEDDMASAAMEITTRHPQDGKFEFVSEKY